MNHPTTHPTNHPTKHQPATILAWSLWTLWLLLAVTTAWVDVAKQGSTGVAVILLPLGWAVVGGLVALREPANAIGWLLLVAALAFGLQGLAEAYLTAGADGGLASAAAWYDGWAWYVWFFSAGLLLPLLFPNGRLPSPRWRVVLVVDLAALTLCIAGQAFAPGALDVDGPHDIANPLGLHGWVADMTAVSAGVGSALAVLGLVLGAASFVVRLRRSNGRERRQLKVLALVVVSAAAAFVAIVLAAIVGELFDAGWARQVSDFGWLPGLMLIIVGVPLAVAIAILRHRLYDIDVVINRAVVYTTLTATLATTYVGSVLVLQRLLSPRTGTSDLAVTVSTLAVAALFRPARRRIQAAVDRHFFRRRYDTARTLDDFAVRLRHELDLSAVGDDLCTAVRETVQPDVTLTLAPPMTSAAAPPRRLVTLGGRCARRQVSP